MSKKETEPLKSSCPQCTGKIQFYSDFNDRYVMDHVDGDDECAFRNFSIKLDETCKSESQAHKLFKEWQDRIGKALLAEKL